MSARLALERRVTSVVVIPAPALVSQPVYRPSVSGGKKRTTTSPERHHDPARYRPDLGLDQGAGEEHQRHRAEQQQRVGGDGEAVVAPGAADGQAAGEGRRHSGHGAGNQQQARLDG